MHEMDPYPAHAPCSAQQSSQPFGSLLARVSLALALANVGGCDKNKDELTGPDLKGRTFHAQSASDEGEAHMILGGTTLTLSFQEGGQVSASSGCNSLGGSYVIEGDKLVVSDAGWTEIGCDPELDAQETWYFTFLQSQPLLTESGDDLTLKGDVTEIVYLDKEVATPDAELVGPVWTVDTLIDGETASSADWSELATLRFTAQGQVEVTSGCNSGAGDYTTDGDTLSFDDVGVSEAGCPDDLQQELEAAVLRVLQHADPVGVEIDADRMWLKIPGAGLGLIAD